MEDVWFQCNILYYCREKYYNRMYKIARNASAKYPERTEYPFYCGIAQIFEGQTQKGIQELTPLQSNSDLQLGVILALMFVNKRGSAVDREALHGLDSKLKEERKHSNALSLYYGGLFLSLAEKYEKSADYISKSLKKDPNNVDAIILKAWNEMFMNTDLPVSVSDCFELALNKNDRNVEATLGLAKFRFLARNHEGSNLLLDKIIVNHDGQVVPLVEKMKNEFAMKKWESVLDTMERIFILDPENIDALKIRIFFALCNSCDYIDATDQLNKFFTCLENEEPHNGYQFYGTAQLFSRICDRSSTVLSQVYRFVQYASEMYPTNVEYLSEIGRQCLLQGKTKDAHNFFRAASKIDSNSTTALCGLTLCQMSENGPTEQIAQQVELLFEMQGPTKLPILLLLSAKLSRKEPAKAMSFLDEASLTNITHAGKLPYGLDYINELDPEFLLEVYKEYQQHLPKKPFLIIGYLTYNEDNSHPSVTSCLRILETIYESCPGLLSAVFELAKLKFSYGYSSEALKLAQKVLDFDNTHAGSYILMAQIYIQQQLFTKAAQTLEVCLGYNFKVRDSAMYHLINGIILKNANNNQEALASFATSLQSLHGSKSNASATYRTYDSELNITDKATLYLQLIEVRTALGQFAEAGKVMQEAIQEFSYTSEEGRLVLAKAELALWNGDIDRCIDLLNEVKFGQPYYFQAHTKMAHVYLKEKNDRAMFTSCFRDVVSNHPVADSHAMMGDAYMSINEPGLAVEAYENALNTSPSSVQLVKKMANALVKTHYFTRATQLYEDSMKNIHDDELKFEYIELLIKLKQYDKADTTISSELAAKNKEKELSSLKHRVRLLLLQAKAREEKSEGAASNTILLLMEAKELQASIVKRAEIHSRGDIQEEKQLLSAVLCSLAKAKSVREPASAANLYAEALINVPRDPATLLALARLYAQMSNSEKCEQTCAILLNTDPNNESAAVMMADLAFRKVDFDTAQRHLSQILLVNPTSWEALAQLVEVQWRRGKLVDAEQVLETAKTALGESNNPGYWYCAGVVAAYAGRPNAALRQLNQCRRSERWGQEAARRMVLLCLTQDAPASLTETLLPDADVGDTRLLAIRTAEKLLAEVSPHDRRPLQALLTLAGRQKAQAERVLQDLLPLATDDSYQDDPFVILAMANAYNLIKQPTRAKNALKRTISSIPWTPEKADGLEMCWLEVAEAQVSSGRGDAARDLLNRIITHNKSCAQAYQYLGYLAEKEQNFKQAALNYDSAWTYSGKSNYPVGFKLAHSYLKLKKYPEAIIICRHVLKASPDYPKIRKEILEKAKTNLRT